MADEKNAQATEVADATPAEPVANKPRSGLLPVLIIGVVLIGVSAGVTYFAVRVTLKDTASAKPAAIPKQETVDLNDMLVNVAETKAMRVLKIKPTLVVSDGKLKVYLESNVAMVRDRVAQAAARMSLEELEGVRGRENLKREIITAVNDAVKEQAMGGVVEVYFHEFLVQ